MAENNVINNYPNGGPIQIIYNNGGGIATSSASPTDITGTSTNITPANVNNNILIMASIPLQVPASGGTHSQQGYIQLLRNGSVIGGSPNFYVYVALDSLVSVENGYGSYSLIYVDSPASTSAVTYKLQQYNNGTDTLTSANVSIILMEFAP